MCFCDMENICCLFESFYIEMVLFLEIINNELFGEIVIN